MLHFSVELTLLYQMSKGTIEILHLSLYYRTQILNYWLENMTENILHFIKGFWGETLIEEMSVLERSISSSAVLE